MTKLVFDLIAVDRSSDPSDAITLGAPRVRPSVRGSGVVTSRKVTLSASEGERVVDVEPGPLEVRIVSGKSSENLTVVVPDEPEVLLSDLLYPAEVSENELTRLWDAVRELGEAPAPGARLVVVDELPQDQEPGTIYAVRGGK